MYKRQELDLDTVKVGQSVSAVNYMTGDTYEGTISEISDVPDVYKRQG